jgi:hypothetical protein
MTSFRQIAANRHNASKSTGPTTTKASSALAAMPSAMDLRPRVVGALEDAEDYRAFEAAITADYDAQSAVERELVLRLASLLWRLRRATTMETGLFEIQADHLSALRKKGSCHSASRQLVYAMSGQPNCQCQQRVVTIGQIRRNRYIALPRCKICRS